MTDAVLLERDRELSAVDALIADASAGSGRLLLIEGPAGIGKSQLLASARHGAEPRLRVLAARVGELEREFPFGVVRQLFEAAALADPGAFDGAAAPARAAFAPLGEADDGTDTSFAVLHGLYWLALNLSESRPLMLSIDDLHWCDRPSLRFLAYLLRRLEGVPILVGATIRSTEPGTDPSLLAELGHDPATVALSPGPLSELAVGALVRDRLGTVPDPVFRSACFTATGGNPLLLRQLLTALAGDAVAPLASNAPLVREIGPRGASRTVLLRLARLPADAVPVARAVAVLGEAAELPAVAALAGIDEARAAAAIGELTRADILAPGSPLDFVHPLVRETVYRELSPVERALEHARAADQLAAAGASLDHLAAQLLLTPPRGQTWVAETLHAAGTEARRRGAADGAVAYLRRALAEPPEERGDGFRARLLFELGAAEALTDGPAAIEHLREAYGQIDEPVAKAMVANVLGRALAFTGAVVESADIARAAAAQLPDELGDLRDGLLALEAMSIFFGASGHNELVWLSDRRDPLPPGAGVGAKALAAVAAVEWAYTDGSAERCAALARQALSGGDLVAFDPGLLGVVALIVLTLADDEGAIAAWEAADADAHRRGSLLGISAINGWHGFALFRRGELDQAERLIRGSVEEIAEWGYGDDARSYFSMFLIVTLLERGDLDGARAVREQLPDTSGIRSEALRYNWFARMELAIAEDDPDQAIVAADALRQLDGRFTSTPGLPWRSLAALAHDRLGARERALELARDELARAQRWGAPWWHGRALRILGTIEREEGLDHLREAVDVLAGSPARLEHAKALFAYGGALRRGREPAASREPLRRALELASACAAVGLAEQVRGELYAAGARPRTDALAGVEALTASERRVVDLAAAGRSNRDIAQALYVTPKTIEVHLTNAYRKLGIRSRRELAGALTPA
ncbi:MAG TPA: AAA family ATPase [Conexibacter sp.]|nr:AAA family ATPase [Conexibacter sp.]